METLLQCQAVALKYRAGTLTKATDNRYRNGFGPLTRVLIYKDIVAICQILSYPTVTNGIRDDLARQVGAKPKIPLPNIERRIESSDVRLIYISKLRRTALLDAV